MRQAARPAKVITKSIPSPVGGLNAVNSIAEMPATDAIVMDNWEPGTVGCKIRPGTAATVTGFTAPVESLMTYNSATKSQLFAAAGTAIYDVTAPGALGAAVVSGQSNARWQHVNYGTIGGQFMLCANGVDDMQYYDGTTWKVLNATSTPAITGVPTSSIKDLQVYANRIWLIEKGSFRVWYLPLQSIAGAASSIDLSSLYILGGYLVGMVTWQVSSTYGMQDYVGFVSSEGEVLLYQGTDPSNAATWGKVGQFRIGRPIGQRFYERAGNDTLLITEDGIMPMSKAVMNNRQDQSDAISFKIMQLVTNDTSLYGKNFGWQTILYPIGNRIVINVPRNTTSNPGDNVQYVMNTITNKWCRYTGIGANCWALFEDKIFYGGVSAVYQAMTGNDDNGTGINALCIPAYSYFGASGQQKLFTAVRPIITANGGFSPSIGLMVDFQGGMPSSVPQLSVGANGSKWDISAWNSSSWGATLITSRDWQWLGGIGFAASMSMASLTKGIDVTWSTTDFVYEPGGVL